jgi:AraC-like DNA-binding protein
VTIGYELAIFDSFDPDVHAEVIAESPFEQRLLGVGRFRAELERLALPHSRLDRGWYSLPAYGRGAIPSGWINIGLTHRTREPAWVNGLRLHADELQVYAEGAPVDYRCVPGAAWYAFQVRREFLQGVALAISRIELPLPAQGMANFRLPHDVAARLRAAFQASLRTGSTLTTRGELHGLEWIENRLSGEIAQALSLAVLQRDGRTQRSIGRRLRILRALEEFMQQRPVSSFAMRDLVTTTGASERSLEYLVGDAYGVSPRELFRIVRLHQIRNDLLSGDPRATSVRTLAQRWHVLHQGRFAAAYESLFQELPRETLARRRR